MMYLSLSLYLYIYIYIYVCMYIQLLTYRHEMCKHIN